MDWIVLWFVLALRSVSFFVFGVPAFQCTENIHSLLTTPSREVCATDARSVQDGHCSNLDKHCFALERLVDTMALRFGNDSSLG